MLAGSNGDEDILVSPPAEDAADSRFQEKLTARLEGLAGVSLF